MRLIFRSSNAALHIVAGASALYFAWHISQSAFFQTGLQFIGPLVVVMLVHLLYLCISRELSAGFASLVYRRSAQTSAGMALFILLASILAPHPANAGSSDVVVAALMLVFCVAVIAIVMAMVAFGVYLIYRIIVALVGYFVSRRHQGPDSRLFDFGSLAMAGIFLSLCSLEGLPNSFSFAAGNRSVASQFVNAPPAQIWQIMARATSPDFPLPGVLSSFPQPIEVAVDEGTGLGAMRQVKFQGREGAGYLTLKVIQRTETEAVFEVVSDTTPYANWVAYNKLIYHVEPEGLGARVTVALEYDRLLAPAWFFVPITRGAAYLAMDVLARDVKTRAEG